MDIKQSDKFSSVCLELGCQYYAIARYCASISFGPIYATMFHHAIEMLIKGYLVRSHTPYELRNVGHRLSNLWSMFKLATGDAKLTRYDKTISDLDRVELLRYPDAMVDEGFILKVRLGVPASEEIPSTSAEPQYFVNVSDLDDIALAIFNVCNVNPKACFKNTPTELMRTLPQNFRLWE